MPLVLSLLVVYMLQTVSIKMCLSSVNDISKCGGEYKIARKVDIVLGLICSISTQWGIFKLM